MAGLLSDAEKLEIRAAIKSVTDTFMVTPIVYHLAGESLDVWNEDRRDTFYHNIRLNALNEYVASGLKNGDIFEGQGNSQEDGFKDFENCQLTFNLEDLQAANLIDETVFSGKPKYAAKFVPETDYFTLRGKVYKVTDIVYDGPLDEKNVLVIVKGRLSPEVRDNFGTNITDVLNG